MSYRQLPIAFLGIVLIAGIMATVSLVLKRPPQQLELLLLPERKDLPVEVSDEPDRPLTDLHDFLSTAYSRIGDFKAANRHRQMFDQRPQRTVNSERIRQPVS